MQNGLLQHNDTATHGLPHVPGRHSNLKCPKRATDLATTVPKTYTMHLHMPTSNLPDKQDCTSPRPPGQCVEALG